MFLPHLLRTSTICSDKNKLLKANYDPSMYVMGHQNLVLTFCMLGNFSCFCCRLLTFQNVLFSKTSFRNTINVQTVWIQIRTDNLPVLIWVLTFCEDYQQTTKCAASMERDNQYKPNILFVGHIQTVETQIRQGLMWHLIRVSTVCLQKFL